MKRIYLFNIALLLFSLQIFSQEIPVLKSFDVSASSTVYCNYNLENNTVLFVGIYTKKYSSELDKVSIKIKNLDTGNEYTIKDNLNRLPIGWLDTNHVIVVDLADQDQNPGSKIELTVYAQNIYNGDKITVFEKCDSIYDPSEHVVVDKGCFIFQTKDTKYYKYDFNNETSVELLLLRSFIIHSYAYNKKNDVLAFYSNGDNNDVLLGILKNDKIKYIEEIPKDLFWVNSLTYPIVFSYNSNSIYYVEQKEKGKTVLKSYSLINENIEELYVFPEGAVCNSFTTFGPNKFILSLSGIETKIGRSSHPLDGSQIHFEYDLSAQLYVLEF